MSEAVDAFDHAAADETFAFTPEAQASYDAARKAVAHVQSNRPSETDALLAAAGYGSYDPLDPTGASGELIPSAEDTGFFSVSEEDLVAQDMKERKVRRKHRHTGLKVFITILVVLLIAVGGCAFAYWRGFGWPTQQTVVESLFKAKTDKTGIDAYLANSLSDSQRQAIDDSLPSGCLGHHLRLRPVHGASTVYATADLSQGGTVSYTIELVRDGISWKVSSVQTSFSSQSDGQGN